MTKVHKLSEAFGENTQVSLYYLHQVADILRSHNVSEEQWLEEQGLEKSALQDSQLTVPIGVYCQLINRAMVLAKLPHLGLIVGSQLTLNHHGALGFALLNCGTIREMLAIFQRYLITRTPLFNLQITRQAQTTLLFFDCRVFQSELSRTLTEVLVTSLVTTLESMINVKSGFITDIEFAFEKPSYADKYQQLAACPIGFDALRTRLSLHNQWVDKQLRSVDPHSLVQAKAFCEKELSLIAVNVSWKNKVLMEIIRTPDQYPNISRIASRLSVSSRTLHRHLVNEGSSFKTIVDEVLSTLAKQYLVEKNSTVKCTAYRLGYAEVANFRRAFKRWTGLSPQQYMQAEMATKHKSDKQ